MGKGQLSRSPCAVTISSSKPKFVPRICHSCIVSWIMRQPPERVKCTPGRPSTRPKRGGGEGAFVYCTARGPRPPTLLRDRDRGPIWPAETTKPFASERCVRLHTRPTAPAGTHVGDSDCVGGDWPIRDPVPISGSRGSHPRRTREPIRDRNHEPTLLRGRGVAANTDDGSARDENEDMEFGSIFHYCVYYNNCNLSGLSVLIKSLTRISGKRGAYRCVAAEVRFPWGSSS